MTTLEHRENVPDPKQVADWLVRDVRVEQPEGQGYLDAIATTDGLTPDDLRAVAIELAHRAAEIPDTTELAALPLSKRVRLAGCLHGTDIWLDPLTGNLHAGGALREL